ncbi:MAG: OsmC family protein [Candidatus Hermodarchaeota archaeon]
MAKVEVIYDESQHCTAIRLKDNNKLSMDCPYTGKGEEFSPGDALGASVAGCMLISIGAFAMRHEIELKDTRVDVETKMGPKHVEEINLVFNMPKNYEEKWKKTVKKNAEMCPIKHSFIPEVKINVIYKFPE